MNEDITYPPKTAPNRRIELSNALSADVGMENDSARVSLHETPDVCRLGRQSLLALHGCKSRRENLRNRRHISGLPRDPSLSLCATPFALSPSRPTTASPRSSASPSPCIKASRRFLSQVTGHRPEFPSALQDNLCVCIISVHPQSLPTPEPPSDQHQHQHLSHVAARPPDDLDNLQARC